MLRPCDPVKCAAIVCSLQYNLESEGVVFARNKKRCPDISKQYGQF